MFQIKATEKTETFMYQ